MNKDEIKKVGDYRYYLNPLEPEDENGYREWWVWDENDPSGPIAYCPSEETARQVATALAQQHLEDE